MTPRDHALRYAAAGWRVYPVEGATKKAMFTGWQKDATTDPEVIARHWRREPYPNVGLICGEAFAVFDIEAAHLPAFYAYVDRLKVVLPEMPVSQSGRGGLHLYVAPIATVTTTRKLRLEGVHIGEFKTTGGVLAPPSVTVGSYCWLWWPDDPTPPEAPDWLRRLVAQVTPPKEWRRERSRPADPALALDILARAVRDEREGNRNGLLYWAACTAAVEGIRPEVAAAVLRRAALKAGLGPREVDATIASAFTHTAVPR